MARLFVAVALSDEARAEAVRAIDALKPSIRDAKWVPAENLHATVAFLGETPLVDDVVAAVRDAAAPFPPVRLRLEGAGCFPTPRRARVLWAGLGGDVAVMTHAAAAVATALEPLGFEPDSRPFAAHVTLARLRTPGQVDLSPAAIGPVPFTADGLVVYRSHLGRPSPRYEALATAPFLGSAG